MHGRGVVWLTIVAFAFLVFAWVGVEVLRLPTRRRRFWRAGPTAGRACGSSCPWGSTIARTGQRAEALAFDGRKGPDGLNTLVNAFPGNELRDPLDMQPRRALRRPAMPPASPPPTPSPPSSPAFTACPRKPSPPTS